MSDHPANLAVRFILEMVALVFLAMWGWHLKTVLPIRIAASTIVPLVAAAVWGAVATPHDVVRSTSGPIIVSGPVRLIVEIVILAGAAVSMYAAGYERAAIIYIAVVVIQSAASWDRWKRLLTPQSQP